MKDKANLKTTTVLIACPIQPQKKEEAVREFKSIIEIVVSNEEACHDIRLFQDIDDANRLLLVEHWDSKEAFTGPHMQTPHMQAFLERAKGFLAGPPEFRFGVELANAS